MTSKFLPWISIFLAAAGFVFWNSRRQERDAKEIAALKVAVATLAQQEQKRDSAETPIATALGYLAKANANANVNAASEHPRALDPVPASSAAEAQSNDDLPGTQAPPMRLEQGQKNVLAAYEAESTDPKWSGDAYQKMDASTRQKLPSGSRVRSLECRSTMCKVVAWHTTSEAAQSFLMDGFHDWPGARFVADEVSEGGGVRVTLIAAREGTQLPYLGRESL